jgi:glycosyltransferase involved in cell wall biosynthesis
MTDAIAMDWINEVPEEVVLVENNYLCRQINPVNDLLAIKFTIAMLKEYKPDIIHCHSSKAGIIGRIAGKLVGKSKVVYTPHAYAIQNPNISKLKWFICKIAEQILGKYATDMTINVSNGEKEFAVSTIKTEPEKHRVVLNGINDCKLDVDTLLVKQQLDINPNHKVVGVVARMDTQKNPLEFIKIAKKVCDINEEVDFVYIGDGVFFDKVKDEIKEFESKDRIHLLGHRNDIEQLLPILDIYLITSLYEGLPYSLVEALRAGLPIVATNTIGNNEVVIDKWNGFLYEIGDIDIAVSKITLLLNEISLQKKQGNNSRKFYLESFTLDSMLEKTNDIYKGLLGLQEIEKINCNQFKKLY